MEKKRCGQYMTPRPIVTLILDALNYDGEHILRQKIMEPSFGEGAFLLGVVERIIREGLLAGLSRQQITSVILANTFGIEKDPFLYTSTIENLDAITASFGLGTLDWSNNLLCGDTLRLYHRFVGTMDYVVGNPPYVQPENMDKSDLCFIKGEFQNCSGKTDLYIAFYELGLLMLNDNGKLGYISPNSFLKNTSQKQFRNHLIENKLISKVYDFKTSKVFFDADTYTCICVLDKSRDITGVEYREYDMFEIVESSVLPLSYFEERLIDRPWNLSSGENIRFLTENQSRPVKIGDIATVQNGIATNRDGVYVHKVFTEDGIPYYGRHIDPKTIVYLDDGTPIESTILHRCVKASLYDGETTNLYIITPYDIKSKGYAAFEEEKVKTECPLAYKYLSHHRQELEKRDIEYGLPWYLFGRSQGLVNGGHKKIVFKHIIERNNPIIRPHLIDEDVLVYSGIFTTVEDDSLLNRLVDIFADKSFARYLSLVGKDMRGGYISFSAKSVKDYGIVEQDCFVTS